MDSVARKSIRIAVGTAVKGVYQSSQIVLSVRIYDRDLHTPIEDKSPLRKFINQVKLKPCIISSPPQSYANAIPWYHQSEMSYLD